MNKRILFLWCALIGLLLEGNLPLCHAQMGTPKWNFKNRSEVKAAVLKNLNNLRTSYEIITCAGRQGMLRSVVQTYEGAIGSKTFDASPELCSSYALAHHWLTYTPWWTWKYDADRSIKTRGGREALQVTWFRERAMRYKSNEPEVLLASAIYLSSQKGQRFQALKQVEEALKRASRWAELHYWHNAMLHLAALSLPNEKRPTEWPRAGAAMLRALDTAEKLDPFFAKATLIDRQYAYSRMAKHKEALAAFDAYIRAYPGFVTYLDREFGKGKFQQRRAYLVTQAQK